MFADGWAGMDKLRIALFSDIYKPSVNGVVNHVALLRRYLLDWGHTVYLFVPGSGEHPEDASNIIRIPGIPLADTGYHLSLRLTRSSRALLRDMDLVHVHQPFISGSFGLYCHTHYDVPLVFTNHTRYDLYVKAYLPLVPDALSSSALQAYFQHFSRHCAALIAPSSSIARVMKSWHVQGRIQVIPNGIELDRFYDPSPVVTRADFGLDADTVLAIYVGRLSPEKSLKRLLMLFARVAAQVENVRLMLVGAGSEQEDLLGLARRLKLTDRVIFTGAVDYDAVPAHLRLADLFVSTSVSEVHPLTFIEAAAAGLPALGIHSTGVVDIVQDEETGLIAPDSDAEFERRFLRLIEDGELRRRLGKQARTHSHEYAAETNARRMEALYREICRRDVPATTGN